MIGDWYNLRICGNEIEKIGGIWCFKNIDV